MLLIGSRHRRGSCSAAYRFARSGNVPADPKVDLDGPDSSLGVHRSPLRRHDGHCVHARLGRRPDFGSGLPRPELVPLLPFLPASAVFYAASGSEDPLVRLSAGLLHPAAGHGVHHVSDSLARSFDRASGPKAVDLAVHPEVVPGGEYPSKRSPPRQPDHVVTASRPFGRDRVHRLVCPLAVPSRARCRVATVRCAALRPQGFLPPRSPLRCARRCRCAPARCSLGLWIDSFPMLPRVSRCPALLDISPGGPNRVGVPRPERRGKAGMFRPCLAPATRAACFPEGRTAAGRRGSGTSRRKHLGRTPPWAPKD